MKLKTTILFAFGTLLLHSCSQRSYVISFQPINAVNTPSTGYRLPEGLQASTTTPEKVRTPEETQINKSSRRSVYDSRSPQTTAGQQTTPMEDNNVERVTADDIVDPEEFSPQYQLPVAEATPNRFVGNESEHIKFANYNPFVDGSSFKLDLTALASEFCYPIAGRFSSGYGAPGRAHHSGVDLVAPALTPVYAAFDGVVRLSKPYSGYGNVIVVRHDNGLETIYAHNSKNLVKAGETVTRGQKIAACGRTGRATTEHLHFEVRVIGQHINPLLLIDAKQHTIQSGVLTISKTSAGTVNAKLLKANTVEPAPKDTRVLAQRTEPKIQPEAATQNDGYVAKPALPVSPRSSNGIRVGDKIYDAPKSNTKAGDTAGVKYHTIARGDTLYSIAKKYSTTVAAICQLNNITKDTVIKIDKKLRVK